VRLKLTREPLQFIDLLNFPGAFGNDWIAHFFSLQPNATNRSARRSDR
jgi:hypothetical protein